MNVPALYTLAAGDYWYYGNAVVGTNLIYISHNGVTSHINADTKTIFRNNGTAVS